VSRSNEYFDKRYWYVVMPFQTTEDEQKEEMRRGKGCVEQSEEISETKNKWTIGNGKEGRERYL
jgi:hypothetical protein